MLRRHRAHAAAGLAVSILAMLWLVGPGAPTAGACSCLAAEEGVHFEGADAVFVGEVLDRELPPPEQLSADAVWTFGVSEVFKGDVTAVQEVRSSAHGASCGLEIEPVGSYVVFASSDGTTLTANLCGGTRSAEGGPLAVDVEPQPPTPVAGGDGGPDGGDGGDGGDAAADPDPGATGGASDDGTGWLPWAAAGAVVAAAAGAGWFALRRSGPA